MRRCCGRGRAASSEQPALALFVVWRLANARRCRTSEPVACGLAAGMRRRRTCRRSSPSIKPLGRVVGGVGRSNLDRLRVRGRCAQCANPGAVPCPPCISARVGLEGPHCRAGGSGHPAAGGGSAEEPPLLATDVWLGSARAAVRWRDGVTVPWQPLRQRAATKDATRREVSARGGDVNPHLGRGSLLVWCVPWWKGHLGASKVGPAGRWSTPLRRPRVLRGAVVEVAQGRCYVPRA